MKWALVNPLEDARKNLKAFSKSTSVPFLFLYIKPRLYWAFYKFFSDDEVYRSMAFLYLLRPHLFHITKQDYILQIHLLDQPPMNIILQPLNSVLFHTHFYTSTKLYWEGAWPKQSF